MLEARRYSTKDYTAMIMFFMQRDNFAASAEVRDHEKYFDRFVKVVKGRKVPKGTVGKVFWLKGKRYGGHFFDYSIRVGIKTNDGQVFWTSTDNIELDLEFESDRSGNYE